MKDINEKIHSIRNPLNTISMNAELGRLSLQNGQNIEKALEAFEVIIRECQNCSNELSELKIITQEK